MKKFSKKKIILLVFLLLVVGVAGLFFINSHTVFPFITQMDVVYMPEKVAIAAYHEISIDSYDCWILKPNKQERETLLEEVKTDLWSKMEPHHSYLLERMCSVFNDGKVIDELLDGNEKYICVYDVWHEKNITNCVDVGSVQTTQWIFYVTT